MFAFANVSALRAAAAIAVTAGLLAAGPASADRYQRWIDITNDGSSEIVKVQISNVDKDTWGRDLLGQYVIDVDDTMRLEPRRTDGYCKFDMKLTYADGEETIVWDINLCEATGLTANEWDYDVSYA